MENQPPPKGNLLELVVRPFWLLVGNGILFILAAFIAQRPSPVMISFSWFDAAYAATVIALAVARYVDIIHLGGTTELGEPATPAHLRRYLMLLAGVSAGIWILAHAIALWSA
ncbi:MAG: hypothetical protein V1809_02425 [Planctomycetota bacterium]